MGSNKMKYGFALSLIFGLAIVGSGFGQDTAILPAPAFASVSDMGGPALKANLASYFPGVGDSSELKLASCEEGCGDACGSCGDAGCCGRSCCSKGIYVWGDFLYLNARDSEVAFAVPINGPIVGAPANNPIPVGPVAVLDPDYSPGFRVGFAVEMAPCSRLGAEFTHFESQSSMATAVDAPLVLRSLVAHPLSTSATTDFLQASGSLDVDFDLIDIDYRHTFLDGCSHSMNYLLGVRYGHLDQSLQTRFEANGVEDVFSKVGFDGGGIRLGLEGEKHSCHSGLLIYGKAIASFVAGDFNASYQQSRSDDPIVANTSWKAGRVVTMTDVELGGGWMSCNGLLRLTAGYTFSKWFNTVMVDEYISAVQNNDYVGLGDGMTFDGFVARAELRF
jgi:major outer membrane protein